MYRRNNNKVKTKQRYQDNTTYNNVNLSDKNTKVAEEISIIANKNLPHSSLAIKADPYEAATNRSEPYKILNGPNKKVSPSYVGDQNIDGGNVQQYASSSNSSFLKYFDIIRGKIALNYRFIDIDNTNLISYELVDEMRKSIAETVSAIKATTFTNMGINNYAVVTDLAMGSATTTNIAPEGETAVNAYTDLTDVLYSMAMYYQIFLQEALSVINWHNSFRMKQGMMVKNDFNRAVPMLNGLFGLFNKAAFLNKLDGINLSFEGEYLDLDFMKQINILSLMPSRRENSITSPVLELQTRFNHPSKFEVYILNSNGEYVSSTPFFSDSDMSTLIDPDDPDSGESFWEICDNIKDYLSAEATVLWARSNYVAGKVPITDVARYNYVVNRINALTKLFTIFKPKWADFREAFDVLSRVSVITWTKGFKPSTTKDTDGQLFHNLLIEDVFKMILAGPDEIDYDDTTMRWRTFSLWDKYNGIPSYDLYAGGSFLTFSFKDYPESADVRYIPLLFTYDSNGSTFEAVSRDGYNAVITYKTVTMSTDPTLGRLVPLTSQASLKVRLPYIKYSNNDDLSVGHLSALNKILTDIFGCCNIDTGLTTSVTSLNSDIIAIYEIEITDITNSAIAYARYNAPLRGATNSTDVLGFKHAPRDK